ncbi:signal transducer [Moniliophthora roreri MCA 2997]|uniref:Signal transducer n=2 Tax=Moniliophthora roreri TaxID=221103 RepID=V2WX67_MONRO|nr:signal transducer [Moniliophthora roreri MCA 2997]
MQRNEEVFRAVCLNSDTFFTSSNDSINQTGTVTCSAPLKSIDGRTVLAIGCSKGVWVGFQDDPKSIRQVIPLKKVTECATLGKLGLFLVLADKALYAYEIDTLLPKSPEDQPKILESPKKISDDERVHLFRTGELGGRTLVITVKNSQLSSVLCALEPELQQAEVPNELQMPITFKKYRECYIASPTHDIVFLKTKLVGLAEERFGMLDLSDLSLVTTPPQTEDKDQGFLKRLFKSTTSLKPLGIFAVDLEMGDKFLLCYDGCGLYTDKNGNPDPDTKIKWEAIAERVALHSPYVLLFNSDFIEAREIQSGKLVQKIEENGIRCLWDGREADGSQPQQARVHAVDVKDGNRTRHEIIEIVPVTDSESAKLV